MSDDLYRKEAFQSRIKGFTNPVSIKGSLSASILIILVLAVLAGLGTYGYSKDYARKITVPGYVKPGSGSLLLPAQASGQLKILVENGRSVKKGDLLAVIHDRREGDDRDTEADIRLSALQSRRLLLKERIELIEQRKDASVIGFQAQRNALQRKKTMHVQIASVLNREADIVNAKMVRAQELHDRDVASDETLGRIVVEQLTSAQRLIDAEMTAGEIDTALVRLEVEEREAEISLSSELISLSDQMLSIENDIRQVQAQQEVEIFAPIDGTITLAQSRDLTTVRIGDPLFSIDTEGDAFRAVLLAPSSAIGFLKAGDEVKLRYAAFPFREHGVFRSKVLEIDNAAQLPSTISSPIKTGQPVYRVTLEIDQNPISKSGAALRLASGMLLEGSIHIDEKPILFWLLDPVL